MDSKFFLFFIFLNILNSLYSQLLGPTVEFTPTQMSYSTNSDLAKCPCDLSPFCDYNCYCDKKCTDDDKNNFNLKEEDFVYNNNRMEEFKCQSWSDNFKYNKNKAGINIRDHIFNLMCIHFDRSGDKGEFYEDSPIQNAGSEDEKKWLEKFFDTNLIVNGNIVSLYKPDSNGYCIQSNISQYKNGEYSCIDRNRKIVENITINQTFGENNNNNIFKISKVKYIQEFNNYDVLRTPSTSQIIDFTISWKSSVNNQGRPIGYMQGSPIKIKLNGNIYYDEIFFPINDNNGACITNNNINDAINIKSLLFKNNAIFSCRTNDYKQTYIYDNILSKMTLCSSPNDADCNIDIIQNESLDETSESINMDLYIFSQKEGTENNQYYKISFSRLYIHGANRSNIPLIFRIKFYDISESVIKNSKNGKKTSLKDLPEEVINIISGIYH